MKELIEGTAPKSTVATYRGARSRAARMLHALGLSHRDIGKVLKVHAKTVGKLIRDVTPWGAPVLRIRVDDVLIGEHEEFITPGICRLSDFSPKIGLDKEDGEGTHFVMPDILRGKFTLVTKTIFDRVRA